MKILKWIEDNWLICIMAGIALFMISASLRQCGISKADREALKESQGEVANLEARNRQKEKEISKALEMVKRANKAVEEKEAELQQSRARIRKLERQERQVIIGITELPPSEVVQQTIDILKVAAEEVTLTDQGILFTENAAKKNLEILATFSLVKDQRDEFSLALTTAEEALHFEKVSNLNLTAVGMKQAEEIQNLNLIIYEKDHQIKVWKKNANRWIWGFLKGTVVGTVVTIIFVILIKSIK